MWQAFNGNIINQTPRIIESKVDKHFTVLAEGVVVQLIEGFEAPKGNAIMGIKVWASDIEEPPYIVKSIGKQIGFDVTGEIQIYNTEPEQPPKENSYGYDIQFTPFD